ncbi:MAG: AAA family ATPase [Verrucomicrobia bacterium]|nr:AAA family ATPase [Verrucomicrobiota bacterium]
MLNTTTPRLFIAATRQNDGKTTMSLGLLGMLQRRYPRVGYIKPVGQRLVAVDNLRIDEDSVLMAQVFPLNCPLEATNPIAVVADFTRKYLQGADNTTLVKRIRNAFDRVAWEKDFVLCEGSGHAGVGSVFDLSNARIAKILQTKVVMVAQGGIGKPIDEVAMNQALFEREGVEIIGVILNKVLPEKLHDVADFASRGLKRKGLELLGVIPHHRLLSSPTMSLIREELGAESLNDCPRVHDLIGDIVLGAMGVQNAGRFFKRGVLLITPGDREDILLAAAAAGAATGPAPRLAGIVLTGDLRPGDSVLGLIRGLDFPVLLAKPDSYEVASRVHDLTVKTRASDKEKIILIRDLIAQHVDLDKMLRAL